MLIRRAYDSRSLPVQERLALDETDYMNQNCNCVEEFVSGATTAPACQKAMESAAKAMESAAKAMESAAAKAETPVQWCSATPIDALATLDLHHITNMRVSMDFCYGRSRDIGPSSLLTWLVGLAPFKDTLWKSMNSRFPVPGCPWTADHEATAVATHVLVALLSTGPVGISNAIGATNATLVTRMISADGALLKPARPIASVDATLSRAANGQLLATHAPSDAEAHVHLSLPSPGGWVFSNGTTLRGDDDHQLQTPVPLPVSFGQHNAVHPSTIDGLPSPRSQGRGKRADAKVEAAPTWPAHPGGRKFSSGGRGSDGPQNDASEIVHQQLPGMSVESVDVLKDRPFDRGRGADRTGRLGIACTCLVLLGLVLRPSAASGMHRHRAALTLLGGAAVATAQSAGVFTTSAELVSAVAEWTTDAASATGVYGHISAWNTSCITDMSYLFTYCNEFNDDINAWDVGQVTRFTQIFYEATSFDQALNSWDAGQATQMGGMFDVHSAPPRARRFLSLHTALTANVFPPFASAIRPRDTPTAPCALD